MKKVYILTVVLLSIVMCFTACNKTEEAIDDTNSQLSKVESDIESGASKLESNMDSGLSEVESDIGSGLSDVESKIKGAFDRAKN